MNTEYQKQESESLFNYEEAFKRNIGLVSEKDQDILKNAIVAIPGLGGVGGAHLMTLVRMGVGGFHLADQDTFQLPNFNRQYGAKVSTLNANKAEVMTNEALDVNPDLRLKVWKSFIDENNIGDFLQGVDVVIDSVDAFSIESRCLIYREAYRRNIPVVAVGPFGFGAAYFIQQPGGVKFEDYLNITSKDSTKTMLVKFFCGLTPSPHYLKYMDRTHVNSREKYGPSSASAIALCSGIAAIETVKVLTKKGKVYPMPYTHYMDPYLFVFKRYYLPFGNKGPIQRLKCWLVALLMDRERLSEWFDKVLYRDEIETLESPDVDAKKRIRMMREINRAHEWSGTNRKFIRSLETMVHDVRKKTSLPVRILDIGAGGGGLLKAIHHWAIAKGISVELFGLDLSAEFAEATQRDLRSQGVPVTMLAGDACRMSEIADGSFDLVISNLMVHHLRSHHQVTAFFEEVSRVSKYGWLIQDLTRSWRGWFHMHLGFFVGESLAVIEDGKKSVRRAYNVYEIKQILNNSHRTGVQTMTCAKYQPIYWQVKGLKA